MAEENYILSKDFELIKNSKNNIIIFGSIGDGKTTFFNKICGQNFKKGDGCRHTTREVFTILQ